MHNYAISDICFWCLLLRYRAIYSIMHESNTKEAIHFPHKLLNPFKSKINGINQLHLQFQGTVFCFLAYGVLIDFEEASCTKYLENCKFVELLLVSVSNAVVFPMHTSMIVSSLFPY